MVSLLNKFFLKLGYKLQKTPIAYKKSIVVKSEFTTQKALGRMVGHGIEINTVIDVGASDGRWSQECMPFFPEAHYLLVEAQVDHLEGLEEFQRTHKNSSFLLAAAGKENGTIYFDNSELFGGIASEEPFNEDSIKVPVVSLDSEIEKRSLKAPFLLKLDTHGFEVPILEGAKNVISKANLIIIEAYNFNIEEDSLCFWELCDYMWHLGFRPLEVVDLMARAYDGTFWQMDLFFIKKDHPIFKYIKYR
ncbi:FkbM family methyltransferase [Aureisphaera sp. CAU 1614]|uniref:FkbM family methyltransferase n=1 Tax=Halomarinibacterium sedimenti TaxID=2857106 RepID=A0A9X1JYP3_9FLAO|nr:FkbM family methyltransferase [Halomarinibacterium sedimenti]MBW2937727.1 FkbM family methyltransferase [Halomarinibacterium sedimenti]